MATGSFFAAGLILAFCFSGVESVGVCYGKVGDNLPPASDVVRLCQSNNIGGMRIYFPDHGALEALRGTNITVIVDVANSDVQSIASGYPAANQWVQTHVVPYPDVAVRYIAVGNEVIPSDGARYVLPAMKNIQSALASAGLQNRIKVSTAVSAGVLGVSSPPSQGAFTFDTQATLAPIAGWLSQNGAPLLANIYPYFSYISNPGQIPIEFALFTSPGTVFSDGQLQYQNLFDAIVDALYSALEKLGAGSVPVVVSESGWPSDGGGSATHDNAQTYLSHLLDHVGNGTPKRTGRIETYIFAMFDEDQKQPQGPENHFGLFYPNKQPKYNLSFH